MIGQLSDYVIISYNCNHYWVFETWYIGQVSFFNWGKDNLCSFEKSEIAVQWFEFRLQKSDLHWLQAHWDN